MYENTQEEVLVDFVSDDAVRFSNALRIQHCKRIPNLQSWFTNINHYENLPLEINTLKNVVCDQLGDRLPAKGGGVLYPELHCLLPVKDEYSDVFDDIILNEKLVFYEKGFILVDNKLQSIVVPYANVNKMIIYQT